MHYFQLFGQSLMETVSETIDKYNLAILIPHFNNLVGLKKSLSSIVTSKKPIIIIIDDGSETMVKDEHLSFLCIDYVVLYNQTNLGIERSLNKGLDFIMNEYMIPYIARLDCGDIMVKERLDKQIKFLEKNPNFTLVGSDVEFFDNNGVIFRLRLPTDHNEIYDKMMVKMCFIHPAVLFRTEIVRKYGKYPLNFPAAEDYAFFLNIVKQSKTANIPEVLTLVENNPLGISATLRKRQLRSRLKAIYKFKTNYLYFWGGVLKVLCLMILPYRLILYIKKQVYS